MSIHPRWVCLSSLGTASNSSLFSRQNSLKKRGSRSLGKTEKKPPVQVSAPAWLGPTRSRCQRETTLSQKWILGTAVPSPGEGGRD